MPQPGLDTVVHELHLLLEHRRDLDRRGPRAVLGAIRDDGRPRGGLVAMRLAFRPWEIPRVNRLRHDARLALHALGTLTWALRGEILQIAG